MSYSDPTPLPDDIAGVIMSQYAGSPAITGLIESFGAAVNPRPTIDLWFDNVWNLDSAIDYGLNVWGRIVVAPRTIPVTDLGNVTLSDSAYLTLINAKALANISDGSISSFNAILLALFPGLGDCSISDNQDMTLTINLPFTPSPVQAAILALPGLLPRPAGVLINSPGGGSGTLAAAISAGATVTGAATSYAFNPNGATITHGSGSYTYAWTLTPNDTKGTWSLSGGTTATATASVTGVGAQQTSTASLVLVVTDTVTGDTATSSSVTYSFEDTIPLAFTLSIEAGSSVTAETGSHTFGTNTATISGGVGPFLYSWSVSSDANGSWTLAGASTATVTPSVSAVTSGASSAATVTCMTTDTATGASHSTSTTYGFDNDTLIVTTTGTGMAAQGLPTAHGFPPATATVTGGSGSYTYAWSETDDGIATWAISAIGNSCAMGVSSIPEGESSGGVLHCVATDTVTSRTATAAVLYYRYTQIDR